MFLYTHALRFSFYFQSMIRYGLILLCIFNSLSTAAQVKKKIKRGRRNKPESQFMLDSSYLELDWEFGRETITDNLSTTLYPNLAVRYGINQRLEINAEINVITATDNTALIKSSTGTEPVLLGANYLLMGEGKNRPAVILSAQLAVAFLATKNFTANYVAPLVQVDIQKPVSAKWTLGLSSGAFWDGFNPTASFIYNATASYVFTKKWMATTEWFGFINGSPPQHNTDISLTYTFNKNVQLGLTAGTGISTTAHKNYFAINGVWGWSLKKKRTL